MKTDWQNVMTEEEVAEFGALEEARIHLKEALNAISKRRDRLRNRFTMRVLWRDKHVGEK